MTEIIADVEGAFERVEAYVKNLFDNGAPHQQAHAKDVATVLEQAKAPAAILPAADTDALTEANSKITNLQANLDNLLTARDSLQSQLDAANAEIATLKAASPLSAAADPVGGRDAGTGLMIGTTTMDSGKS